LIQEREENRFGRPRNAGVIMKGQKTEK